MHKVVILCSWHIFYMPLTDDFQSTDEVLQWCYMFSEHKQGGQRGMKGPKTNN